MIRALLLRNWHHQRVLLLTLCAGLLLFEMLISWFAAQFDRGPGIAELFQQFLPEQFRRLVATQLELVSFAGFVGFGFQHPFVLVCTIAFAIVAATVPAGERESGLLDLLLARPLTRVRYFAAHLVWIVAGAIVLPTMILVGAALALQLLQVPGELPWTRYLPSAAGLTTLLLALGGCSAFLAAGARRRGTAVAQSVGLTLTLYLLDVLADLWVPLKNLSWLSPFHYYDPVPAAVLRNMSPVDSLVLLGIFAVSAAAATLRFRRQDL